MQRGIRLKYCNAVLWCVDMTCISNPFICNNDDILVAHYYDRASKLQDNQCVKQTFPYKV